MRIQWLGHASFLISGSTRVVTDPFDGVGYDFPKVSAHVVTVSHGHGDHSATQLVGGEPAIVDDLGKHSLNGITVRGYASYHDDAKGAKRGSNIIYEINMDGVRLVHLGDLGQRPGDDVMNAIKGADVLFVPVGGNYTIGAAQAAELVEQLGPKLTIPMHYKTKGLTVAVEPVDAFLQAMGSYTTVEGSELSVGPGLDKVIVFAERAQK